MSNQVPASIEAEEAILGGIIFDPNAIDLIKDWLPVHAFYVTSHQKIYQAALSLREKGKVTDFITLSDWFSSRQLLEDIGGTAKLAQLINRTVSALNIDRYAGLVLDKYRRRELIAASHTIIDISYKSHLELEEAYQEVREALPDGILGEPPSKILPQIKSAKYRITNPKNPSESIELDIDIEHVFLVEESLAALQEKVHTVANKLWGNK